MTANEFEDAGTWKRMGPYRAPSSVQATEEKLEKTRKGPTQKGIKAKVQKTPPKDTKVVSQV